jgi:hypothetical protein
LNFSEDQVGICAPHERFGIAVPLIEIIQHCLLQGPNSGVTATPNAPLGHLCEQAFYKIQSTSAGGREMYVIARMAG